MRWIHGLLVVLLAVLVASQLLTDRIGALQWIWWIPRFALAIPLWVGFALLLAWSPRSERPARRVWAIAALVISLASTWSDWGLSRPRPQGARRVAFWNACFVERADAQRAVDFLLGFDADVIVVTDPGATFGDGGAERLRGAGYTILRPASFAVLSRLPVGEASPLYAARGRTLARASIESAEGPLVIDMVDLPSETTMHRYAAMTAFVGAIDGLRATAADITVGDFNITRGSASASLLAPGARDAFATAGVGWGGTYPRRYPVFAIDQAMVSGARWRAARAEVADPGFGRHRALVVDLLHAEG